MPELPEVETVRRGLQPVLEGARIVRVEARRPDLRFPFPVKFAQRLTGKTITALGRRAKYLTMHMDGGPVLICHLGMSGSFRIETADDSETPGAFHHERSKDAKHDHVVFHVSSQAGARSRVIFNDPRRFGFMLLLKADEHAKHKSLTRLGPEPLDEAFDARALATALARRKTSLKTALADQRVVGGLGNIYVVEALHRARLSPKRRASTLVTSSGGPRPAVYELVDAIGDVLKEAIARQRRTGKGNPFRVYDHEGEPCPTRGCRGTIRRIIQAGRSTYYCPVCQR